MKKETCWNYEGARNLVFVFANYWIPRAYKQVNIG